MPSKPREPQPRRSPSGTTKAVNWYNALAGWQKGILFLVGTGIFLWGAIDVDPGHWSEHGLGIAAAEISLAAMRMIAGLTIAAPPLGMWVIKKAPLPKFLKRDNAE